MDNNVEEKIDEGTTVNEVADENNKSAEGNALRRSTRERRLPKRFESYQMHQIVTRPIDRRLHTLQIILGSGILNEMDSDMTHTIVDAIMK